MTSSTLLKAPRGRPREFDQDIAIDRAMNVFWTQGYHGTSLPDLLKATNLSRGSLYAAFGDKHGLFLLSLDRYIADSLGRLERELESEDPLAGICSCLGRYAERSVDGTRGCLLVATAMELAAHDAEVARRVSHFFNAMEEKLCAALVNVRDAGSLANGIEPAVMARLIMCAIEGRVVLDKTNADLGKSQKMFQMLVDQISFGDR